MATYLFHGSTIFQGKIKATINSEWQLSPTSHAIRASKDDRYGIFDLPSALPTRYEIVELEQKDGINSKYVVRFMYNETMDIVLVLRPNNANRTYTVITAWLNEATDYHNTLNEARYNIPSLVKY